MLRAEGLQKIVLDVGCGQHLIKGCYGIDRVPAPCVNELRDVGKHGIPFPANSVDGICAHMFCEHLSSDEFMFFMREAYRCLKPGAWLSITVPPISNTFQTFSSPTHKSYYTPKTFLYFNPWYERGVSKEAGCWFHTSLVKMRDDNALIWAILAKIPDYDKYCEENEFVKIDVVTYTKDEFNKYWEGL